MKQINTYIFEKLRINNDTKLVSNTNVANIIFVLLELDEEHHENKTITSSIRQWIKNNDILDFNSDVCVKSGIRDLEACGRYDILRRQNLMKHINDLTSDDWKIIDKIKKNKAYIPIAYYENNIDTKYGVLYAIRDKLLYYHKDDDVCFLIEKK